MIDELKPVWKPLRETYQVFRAALQEIPHDKLDWSPGGNAGTVRTIVEHSLNAHYRYLHVVEKTEAAQTVSVPADAERGDLVALLQASEVQTREVFERISLEQLHAHRADRWGAWDDGSQGNSLDVFWFVLQMNRHLAYHLGQINLYNLMLETENRDK